MFACVVRGLMCDAARFGCVCVFVVCLRGSCFVSFMVVVFVRYGVMLNGLLFVRFDVSVGGSMCVRFVYDVLGDVCAVCVVRVCGCANVFVCVVCELLGDVVWFVCCFVCAVVFMC